MTRSELVQKLAEKHPDLFLRDIENVVETFFSAVGDALVDGDRVEIRGFGTFSLKRRDPRTGRNPRTGEQVEIEGKSLPYFKAGKALKDRLNGRA